MDEAAARRKQPSLIVCNGRDRTDCPWHAIGADRREHAIGADAIAVDVTGQNVDAQQLVSTRVPPGAFAEVLLLARAGDGVRTHAAIATTCLMPPGCRSSSGASSRLTRCVIRLRTASGQIVMNCSRRRTDSSNADRDALTVPKIV